MAVKQNLKSKMAQIGLCLFIFVFCSNLLVAETKVPNDFTSGTPAKAAEVNENFDKVETAIDDHWTRYPDRYYPDWRYDPTFYLTLPTLGGFWKGRLLSEDSRYATSPRNINFVNYYDSTNTGTKRIWLGINVVPSVDVAVGQLSKVANGSLSEATAIYKFDMSHHKDGVFANVTYSKDSSLNAIYGTSSSNWRQWLKQSIAKAILPEIYKLLKLESSSVAVSCTAINIHQNADRSITATGTGCVQETPG
jgi:hypothetical protein